jgi:hypothetical protein
MFQYRIYVGVDTDTYNYIELCQFFKLLSVSVSCPVYVSVSVLHRILYMNRKPDDVGKYPFMGVILS